MFLGYLLVSLAVLAPFVGWLITEDLDLKTKLSSVLGAILVVALISLILNLTDPLDDDGLRGLLQLLVTVSGISSGLIFGFLVSGYYNLKSRALDAKKELRHKQRQLNLFREMCNRSMSSHKVWGAVRESDDPSQYEFVRHLYHAIKKLSEDVHGEYHRFPEGEKLLDYSEIENIKEWVNDIWYYTGGDSKHHSVEKYLRQQIGEARLTEQCFLLKQQRKEFLDESDNQQDFPTFNHWFAISGDIYLLCGEMQSLQRKIYHLSPKESLKEYRNLPALFVFGVVLPLLLLSFEFNLPPELFATLCYLVLGVFLYVLILFGVDIHEIMNQDFHEDLVVKDDPQHVNEGT